MRVLNMDEKCAVEIICANREGNKLVFITSANVSYQTDDYYNENIACSKLTDLVVDGYIVVEKLYLKEDI